MSYSPSVVSTDRRAWSWPGSRPCGRGSSPRRHTFDEPCGTCTRCSGRAFGPKPVGGFTPLRMIAASFEVVPDRPSSGLALSMGSNVEIDSLRVRDLSPQSLLARPYSGLSEHDSENGYFDEPPSSTDEPLSWHPALRVDDQRLVFSAPFLRLVRPGPWASSSIVTTSTRTDARTSRARPAARDSYNSRRGRKSGIKESRLSLRSEAPSAQHGPDRALAESECRFVLGARRVDVQ